MFHVSIFKGYESIPLFAGSYPPPQGAERSEEARWGITAGMCPIGRALQQWEMKKTPLLEVSLIKVGDV